MSLDLDLFVEQVGWLGPKLPDPSRLGVLTWLLNRLKPESRGALHRHFPLMHVAQCKAEEAVCRLLRRALFINPSRLCRVDAVTRSVDWPATFVKATRPENLPLPLVARVRPPIPDRSCLSALATLAQTWRNLLGLVAASVSLESQEEGQIGVRRAALGEAISERRLLGLPPVAFDRRHALRLRTLDSTAANDVKFIEEALRFWSRAFGDKEGLDAKALGGIVRALPQTQAQNEDTLLEATVALSIARAAEEASDSADWPTAERWKVISVMDSAKSYPAIVLTSGELVCEITKGTPLDGFRKPVRDLLSPWADAILLEGEPKRAHARQPDLVIKFWLESDPHNVVFVLGDAKRNETDDGKDYLRDSLAVPAIYLMAFGYRMGLQLPDREDGAITTTLRPGVTLFCLQGTVTKAQNAIRDLRSDRETLPVVMALDLKQHFCSDTRPWNAPVLAAWLGSLGRQAIKVLSRGNAAPRRQIRGARA